MEDIITKLKEFRFTHHLTVKKLAELLKCNETYLSSILTKKKIPSEGFLFRMKLLLEKGYNPEIPEKKE